MLSPFFVVALTQLTSLFKLQASFLAAAQDGYCEAAAKNKYCKDVFWFGTVNSSEECYWSAKFQGKKWFQAKLENGYYSCLLPTPDSVNNFDADGNCVRGALTNYGNDNDKQDYFIRDFTL